MTKSKFEIFLIISIVFHVILIYYIKFSAISNYTKLIEKKKEKTPIKVKFIELPEKIKEIKHNKKTPFIAQKSFLAKKNRKKENPLIKQKSVAIRDVIPNFLQKNKKKFILKTKPKKLNEIKKHLPKKIKKKVVKRKTTNDKKTIREKIFVKKKKTTKVKKYIKKRIANKKEKSKRLLSLNKINPNFKELIEKGLIKGNLSKKQNKNKFENSSKTSSKMFKGNPELFTPGLFKPSHIYPDDIDISDSISISTQSSRYASYLHKVKRKIELVWEYPPLAGEMGIQGRLFVKFEIDRNGKLKMIKLLKSSGAKILDQEAIRAIKEAAPYPPFPKDFKISSIKIHACFDYIIVGKEIWW